MTDKDNIEIKPLTGFAPPPLSAVGAVAAFIALSLYYFPAIEDPDASIFTKRVFPQYLTVSGLVFIRTFFALMGFVGFISAWFTKAIIVTPPYRPTSRIARIPFPIAGWRKQFFFTSWSWNVLALSFALSAYIAYQVDHEQPVAPWILKLALILWEIAAPMTLLIGAVVKFALWPTTLKQNGNADNFKVPRALLQHNGNVIMAMTEAALLGGLPTHFSHLSISVLYGCSYVLFTWAIQTIWHGQGPAFIYFFMDTTLGTEHTIALLMLVTVLMVYHALFCGVETILHFLGNNILGHAAFAFAVCLLVCRFRD